MHPIQPPSSPVRRQPNINEPLIASGVGMSIQIALSHAAVGVVVALLLNNRRPLLLALIVGVGVGLLLTLTLQRTIWLLDSALARLHARQSALTVSRRWHGMLTTFALRVLALVDQAQAVSTMRENLVEQVRDTAAQQERNRLARDLHDSIKQQIFSVSMSAAAAVVRFDQDPAGSRTAIEDIRHSAQEAMVEMNALLQQLSPAPLEKVGLQQALRDQCEALGYRTGAQVNVAFGEMPADDRLPSGAQTSLFRVAQEVLSNIARHARAQQVQVYLGQPEPGAPLELRIDDDGRGFDPSTANQGMGLANIRGRVQAMNGTLQLRSVPGQGTSLHIHIPLLEPLETQGETMYVRPDSTLNRIFLVGMLGGLALMAALYYPLFVNLPGSYVADWQAGSPIFGLLLQGVAFLIVLGTGYMAARLGRANSRPVGMLFGAVAGGVAGSIFYVGLGGAAVGLLTNAPMITRGLVPAANETQAMTLLARSVVELIWGTYVGFAAAGIAGLGLGTLGGLLYTPSADAKPIDWANLRAALKIPLIAAVLAGGTSVIVMSAVYSLLEPSVHNIVTKYGMVIDSALVAGVSILPVSMAVLSHLLPLVAIYFIMRHESKVDPLNSLWFERPLATAVMYSLFSLMGAPVALLTIDTNANSSHPGAIILAAVISAILLVLIVRLCLRVRKHQREAGIVGPLTVRHVFLTSLGVIGALASTYFVSGLATSAVVATFGISPWIALAATVILGLIYLVIRRNKRITEKAATVSRSGEQPDFQAHLNGILAIWANLLVITLVNVAAALNLVVFPVVVIPSLFTYDASSAIGLDPQIDTVREVIEGAYLGHAQALLAGVVYGGVFIGVFTLILWGIARFNARRLMRDLSTQEKPMPQGAGSV